MIWIFNWPDVIDKSFGRYKVDMNLVKISFSIIWSYIVQMKAVRLELEWRYIDSVFMRLESLCFFPPFFRSCCAQTRAADPSCMLVPLLNLFSNIFFKCSIFPAYAQLPCFSYCIFFYTSQAVTVCDIVSNNTILPILIKDWGLFVCL